MSKDAEEEFLESLNKDFSLIEELEQPYYDSIEPIEDIHQQIEDLMSLKRSQGITKETLVKLNRLKRIRKSRLYRLKVKKEKDLVTAKSRATNLQQSQLPSKRGRPKSQKTSTQKRKSNQKKTSLEDTKIRKVINTDQKSKNKGK